MRVSWHQHAMNLAEVAKLRSEDPYQKVGACILGHDNQVLSVAYNGLVAKKNVESEFWQDRDKRRPFMIHAETNALSRIKIGQGHLLACTLLPCANCASNIVAHGIKTVIYKELYKRDLTAIDIFKFYNIECLQYEC